MPDCPLYGVFFADDYVSDKNVILSTPYIYERDSIFIGFLSFYTSPYIYSHQAIFVATFPQKKTAPKDG
jgi:hypothetical protein